MSRKTNKLQLVTSEHGWANAYTIETDFGERVILARNNKRFTAAKTLVLVVENAGKVLAKGLQSVLVIAQALARENVPYSVFFLAADRPITYVDNPDFVHLTSNLQIELPGGVAEGNEDALQTGIRETCEELGLTENDIVTFAPLTPFMANDSGGQAEIYASSVAVVSKMPTPPAKEGINPDKCQAVSGKEAVGWLYSQTGHTLVEMAAMMNVLYFNNLVLKTQMQLSGIK